MWAVLNIVLIVWSKHWPLLMLISTIFIIKLGFIINRYISERERAKTEGPRQLSRLQKAANIIIYCALFGVFLALMVLVIFHRRRMGHTIINFSLGLVIVGLLMYMFTPVELNKKFNLNKRQLTIIRPILMIGLIGYIVSQFLRLNHLPGGRILLIACAVLFILLMLYLVMHRKKDSI